MENERIRSRLVPIYKSLPRCVFQGDENFSNVCVDELNQIAGLFDFNMSGMDVIANYLANNAIMDCSVLDDDVFDIHDAKWVFDEIMKAFFKYKDLICEYYNFTEIELGAFYLYAKICFFSGYAHVSAFQYFLKKPEYREECVKLIDLILTLCPVHYFLTEEKN